MNYFPIFAHLKNRSVLVIGAGDVAVRKVQALLEAGAKVNIIAPSVNIQFGRWISEKTVTHLAERYESHYIEGHYLIIAATDNHSLNQRVYQDAEQMQKFCNVVDQKSLCSYITPAIVNRGDIQIAISSSGTAPVLARKIKQQIEQLIPLSIGKIARFANKFRPHVKQEIHSMPARRLFWERLFDGPFSEAVTNNNEMAAQKIFEAQLRGAPAVGTISLVGAGPGDSGLLTLHALQAIASADTVFYDNLVSDEVIKLARKDSEKICVGKKAHGASVAQSEINQLLIQHAKKGERVVRLKGGDPFIFGRGGEECQEIAKAGISFRIIPGITAAIGATAYAGIPLTHRDYAQTVLFITGHCRPNGMDLDWSTLALGKQTLAIYMGTIKSAEIKKQLVSHGRASDTPVAIISNGTLPQQKVLIGKLNELDKLAAQAERPALIIIGEVVNLRKEIQGT